MSDLRYIRYEQNGEWKYANVKTVGDVSTLRTQSKEDIVSAINSLINADGSVNIDQDILDQLEWLEENAENMGVILDENGEELVKLYEKVDLTDEALELLGHWRDEMVIKQQEMEEFQQEMTDRQEQVVNELNDKVNLDRYTKEYDDIVESISDKVDQLDFHNLSGQFTEIEKEITDLEDEVGSKISKTEFDDAVGVNKWISSTYSISETNFSTTTPAFSMIQEKSATDIDEIEDTSLLKIVSKSSQITHLFTNVKLNTAKTVSLEIKFKNSISFYMNGAMIYQNKGSGETEATVSMSLRAGWNTIDILHGSASSSPKLQISPRISTQVDKMTTTIGVGDKNEARLKQTETQIRQTDEKIELKADSTVVESIGNEVTENKASIEVLSDQIEQKVEKNEFNAYSQRLTNAESSITQNAELIEGKVAKTDYDVLNGIVAEQTTLIRQNAESIKLKVEQNDLDELAGVVSSQGTQIGLNKTAISLKAEQSDLNALTGEIGSVRSELNIQAGKIEQTVTKEEFGNLEIGGRNLLKETSNEFKVYDRTHGRGDWSSGPHEGLPVKEGETYTVRVYLDYSMGTKNVAVMARLTETSSSTPRNDYVGNWIAPNGEGYSEVTFTVPANRHYLAINTVRFNSNTSERNVVRYRSLKLEKGNKATDWTPAPEDTDASIAEAKSIANQAKSEASTAQTTANTGVANAKTANDLLSNIASDSRLTPVEKQAVKKEWDIIVGERANTVAQGTKYAISTTAYTNAYNALNTYITPLLSSLTATSNIVGTTFRANFKTYYDAKTALLKLVADKAKDLADSAQATANKAQSDVTALGTTVSKQETRITQTEKDINLRATKTELTTAIDRVEIGGRNLIVLKDILQGRYLMQATTGELGSSASHATTGFVPALPSSEYILSGRNMGVQQVRFVSYDASKKYISGSLYRGDRGRSQSYKTPANTRYIRISADFITKDSYGDWKLEKGNKATDWTPAPEDVDGAIGAVSTKLNTAEATIKVHSDQISQTVTKTEFTTGVNNAISADKTLPDTRNDNRPPSWYFSNYPRQVISEFKSRSTIGAPGSATYGTLTTATPWSGTSGGVVSQRFESSDGTFERKGNTGATAWLAWIQLESTTGAQNKVNSAISPITTRLATAETSIKSNATAIGLRALKSDVYTKAEANNKISTEITSSEGRMKIEANTIALGVAETVVSDFGKTVGNLVRNPALTRSHTGWSGGSVTSANETFQGVSTRVLRNTTTTNAITYSEWFDVDPSKTYEVSMWVRKSAARGRFYVGLHQGTADSNALPFRQISNSTGGVSSSSTTNFYFQTSGRNTGYIKLVAYIMPSGTTPADMKGIGTNVVSNAIADPRAKRMRLRWLNYENGGTATYMYVAQPKVVEVSESSVTRISKAEALIEVNKNSISSKVSTTDFTGNKITSLINQTATTISLNAGKINFNGAVLGDSATFTGTIRGAQISGSRITSGTPTGDTGALLIDGGTLASFNSSTGSIFSIIDGAIESSNSFSGNGANRVTIDRGEIKLEYYHDGSSGIIDKGWTEGIRINSGTISSLAQIQIDSSLLVKKTLYTDDLLVARSGGEAIRLRPDNGTHGFVSFYQATGRTGYIGVSSATNRDDIRLTAEKGRAWIQSNQQVTLGVSGGSNLFIDKDGMGSLLVYNRTYTSTSQMVRVTVNGVIGRSTSSRRYKLLEKEVSLDYAKRILGIDAKSWYDKSAVEDYSRTLLTGEETEPELISRIPGVIAEDVHDAGLAMYVSYDDKDRPDGISHNLWTLLIPITKSHEDEIQLLKTESTLSKQRLVRLEESLMVSFQNESEIKRLKSQIELLQERIFILEGLVDYK